MIERTFATLSDPLPVHAFADKALANFASALRPMATIQALQDSFTPLSPRFAGDGLKLPVTDNELKTHKDLLPAWFFIPEQVAGKVFVDIGCGPWGRYVMELRLMGAESYGYDIRLEEKIRSLGLGDRTDITRNKLKHTDNSVDAAMSLYSVFTYSLKQPRPYFDDMAVFNRKDIEKTLNELYRVLKPGSLLVVAPIPINSHAFDVIMAEKSNADKWEVTASPLRSMVGKNSRGEHLSLQDASQLNAIQPSTNLTLIKIDPASAKTSALKKRRRSGGV